MKRTLIIFVILLVLLGGGAATYYFFFMNKPSVTVTQPGGTNLPVAGQSTTGESTVSTQPVEINTPVAVSATAGARLVQISAGPVVNGETVVDMPAANASSSPEVATYFIERQSGNVFSYLTHAQTLTRINNKTIPGIQAAYWLPSAATAFVQYLSGNDLTTVNTYALSATSSEGFFLPQNLSGLAVSPTNLLTVATGVNGSVGTLEHLDGTHPAQLFVTPLTSLRVSFAGKNQYLAFTKPSANLSGDAFLVTSTGSFSRIAGPLNGLVALASHSGKWVLVSSSDGGILSMRLIDTTTNTSTTLPIATIADKCVWTADDTSIYCGIPTDTPIASYPDDWYQGAVHFSDKIWKIDVAGRYAQFVLDFSKDGKGALDATSLAIDTNKTVLVFVNKNDGSLWSYSL